MPRFRRSQSAVPDQNYQIPHADLVTDPPTLQERTQQHLTRFKFLWEQLGLQALTLQNDIEDLEAAGGCPDHLKSAIHQAIGRVLDADRAPDELKGKGGRGDGNGNGHGIHNHRSIPDVNTMAITMSRAGEVDEESLVQILEGLNFASPIRVLHQYGPWVVSEALRQLLARSPGEVANPGAYLRGILKKYSPRSDDALRLSRFTSGKYGHMVHR